METHGNFPAKTQSCRGVSFETQHHKVLPLRSSSTLAQQRIQSWSRMWPSAAAVQRVASRPSSHFCDLDLDSGNDDDDVDEELIAVDVEKPPLPQQHQKKKPPETRLSIILLDQGLFTPYKRLFLLCLAINMTILALAATGNLRYAEENAAVFSMGNILALTLCRSEAFLRGVFWLAVKLLGRTWVPLRLKTTVTSLLQSLGGIHSGCGVSSIAWLVYALVLSVRTHTTTEIIAVASVILSLLSLSCMAAFPLLRHLHHNVFERTHRFAGWTALALLWVFVLLTTRSSGSSKRLVREQGFWLTLAITFFTVLPWLTVRKVPVSVTCPSGHASIIRFSGGVQPGILGRISRSPLSEWHAFGIISDGKETHMMLAGAVGDFTRGLVSDPPTHLWTRGVHFAGLPYLVNMYGRAVLVATGSGICVFLSFLLQPCAADVCVVWVAKGVEQNFGKEIKEMMGGFPGDKVIVHDTAVSGRPNVAEMAVEAARKWKAEVVVVTSNPEGSRDVVRACEAAGFPSFGPIWDS